MDQHTENSRNGKQRKLNEIEKARVIKCIIEGPVRLLQLYFCSWCDCQVPI